MKTQTNLDVEQRRQPSRLDLSNPHELFMHEVESAPRVFESGMPPMLDDDGVQVFPEESVDLSLLPLAELADAIEAAIARRPPQPPDVLVSGELLDEETYQRYLVADLARKLGRRPDQIRFTRPDKVPADRGTPAARRTPGSASAPARRPSSRSHARRDDPGRSSSGGDDPPPVGRACEGCGEPLGPGRPNRLYHGPNCRKLAFRARHKTTARRPPPRELGHDALMAESAAMGIVERAADGWKLTASAELQFGRAFRALPAVNRDDAQVAA